MWYQALVESSLTQTKILEQQTKLLEQQAQALKSLKNQVEKASKRDEKFECRTLATMDKVQNLAKNAEMRQCQTSGEGTDACRMAD